MRVVTIRRGLYKGEHTVYDSPDEAVKHGIEPKTPWHRKDIQVGDWVVADDGYVVQTLNRKPIINKRHKSGQFTDTFRFPQGIFYAYYNRHGEKRITKNFYAQVTNNNKSSLGNTPSLGRFMTIRKREFVTLVQMGFDMYSAYMKAFNVKGSSMPYITIQINKLLMDKQIQEELMQVLRPFMDAITIRVKELSKYDNLNQLLIDKTAKLLVQETKNIKDQALVLKLSYEMFGKLLKIVEVEDKGTHRMRNISEAHYEEVSPPPLNEPHERLVFEV